MRPEEKPVQGRPPRLRDRCQRYVQSVGRLLFESFPSIPNQSGSQPVLPPMLAMPRSRRRLGSVPCSLMRFALWRPAGRYRSIPSRRAFVDIAVWEGRFSPTRFCAERNCDPIVLKYTGIEIRKNPAPKRIVLTFSGRNLITVLYLSALIYC